MDVKVLDEIHAYWFGDPPETPPGEERVKNWFRPTEAIDSHIRDTWGRYLDDARDTRWDQSKLTRRQQVGLIILLDQFPRQIFRASGEAFAYDARAKEIAEELVAAGAWRSFPLAEQLFLLLPFEHSEAIADQDLSIMYHAQYAVAAPEGAKAGVRNALDFATKHRDIIRKFGRFPHRNQMMGRESTPEEVEFLKGGRGF
jgi:uncharacterized protein (DUF924 family)